MVAQPIDRPPREREPMGHVPNRLERIASPVGGFFAYSLDTAVAQFRGPWQWREFIQQCWFVASVSIGPTIMLGIPFVGLVTFQFNQVLTELGAIDFAGAGSAFASISQVGVIGATFIVAGAVATAICADLGARKIREEIDAMEVLGIDPVQRLVVPRVLAASIMTIFLTALLMFIGIGGGYVYSVYLQGATPGQFVDSMNVIVGTEHIIHSIIRAVVFGWVGGMIGAYRGLIAKGGAKGVGNAVNETVVYVFLALFPMNTVLSQLPYELGLIKLY